jgi:type I restriction enzyme S subunit
MSTALTHIKTDKQLVPALRFNEFEGEWNPSKLGAVTKYVKGFAFKSDDYQDNGVRIVRVSDLAADRIKTDNDKLYIDEQKALDFDKYKLRTGNIVITTVGSKPEMLESAVGRGIYIHNDNEGLLNQNMLKFENIEGVSNGFIIGLINSRRYQHYMKGIARGNANQANITVVELLQYNISYPTLPEQQKIASFLSAVDEKIQQLTKKKALLEQYKKGVMQQLFSGQLRFKDEIGNLYPDWEGKRLGELGIFKGGGTPTTEVADYWNGTIPWISSSDISEENITKIKVSRFINEEAISESATKLISEGSVLFVSRVGVGKLAVSTEVLCTSQDFANFTPSEANPKYIAYYFLVNNNTLHRYAQGTSIKGFTSGDLKSIKIGIPVIEEQKKIATYLSRIDTKIEAVNNQITQTQTFKKGLLQQMFV